MIFTRGLSRRVYGFINRIKIEQRLLNSHCYSFPVACLNGFRLRINNTINNDDDFWLHDEKLNVQKYAARCTYNMFNTHDVRTYETKVTN